MKSLRSRSKAGAMKEGMLSADPPSAGLGLEEAAPCFRPASETRHPAAQSSNALKRIVFSVDDYDLGATLNSGQAFRWRRLAAGWESVIGSNWVRLESSPAGIVAECCADPGNWRWLSQYLQVECSLAPVLATFPRDKAMKKAVAECRGLRLLRQEPWECLASFVLSSTKQIVQIRQIIETMCQRFGPAIPGPTDDSRWFGFPGASCIARCSESELRACKMGFRAKYLKAAAELVSSKMVDLEKIPELSVQDARAILMQIPGVGPKIADCVLLFAYGFQDAFPIDVWVAKALRETYFPHRRVGIGQLYQFSATYFGPFAGYAQQYLFHHWRTGGRTKKQHADSP